jgi:hypothetical protein
MMNNITKAFRQQEKDIQPGLFQQIFYLHRDYKNLPGAWTLDEIMTDILKNAQDKLLPLINPDDVVFEKEDQQSEKAFKASIRRTNKRRKKIVEKVANEVRNKIGGGICY